MCDWRQLNKYTVKNAFALPNVEQLLDQLNGTKWFTRLDLSQGFHQIRLVDDDSEKSTITTRYGNYKWQVMPFGMSNAPSTFSAVMSEMLLPFQDKICLNFMDDILIYGKGSFDEHMAEVRQILTALRDNKFYCNPDKCI